MSQPQQKPGRSKQDYRTPKDFLIAVKAKLGIREFAHDFAADQTNAVAETWWGKGYNSLSVDGASWAKQCGAGWGWLNPEFGDIAPWAERCAETCAAGGRIAFLVPASVGSNWFAESVHDKARVLLFRPRLSFDGIAPYPKDCILCLYGLRPGYETWLWTSTQAGLLP